MWITDAHAKPGRADHPALPLVDHLLIDQTIA
jgi:hypothetical protein